MLLTQSQHLFEIRFINCIIQKNDTTKTPQACVDINMVIYSIKCTSIMLILKCYITLQKLASQEQWKVQCSITVSHSETQQRKQSAWKVTFVRGYFYIATARNMSGKVLPLDLDDL